MENEEALKMKKSKTIIFWEETAYKKGICKTCGTKVKDEDGKPTDKVLKLGKFNTETSRASLLVCPKCLDNVGIVAEASNGSFKDNWFSILLTDR